MDAEENYTPVGSHNSARTIEKLMEWKDTRKKIVGIVNAHDELVIALEQLVVRFPMEWKTTAKKCTCLQFEDIGSCRHTFAVQVLRKWEVKHHA